MSRKSKSLYFLLFSFLVLTLAACSKYYATYGAKQIPNLTDTVYSKQRKATIRSINNDSFESGSFISKKTPAIKYRLFKPQQAKGIKKIPLVVVFHGSDAVGNDNITQLGILAKLWLTPEISAKYPAYVLAPQFPTRSSNYVLDKNRGVLTSLPQPALSTALQLIDSLKQVLNVDEKRIYVLGFSMGASSVINVLSARPELFAAGVSISGIPQFEQVKALSKIPIWLIHGNLDTENPFNSDAQFFKEVSYQNKTRFWEFDGKAHNDIFSSIILGENIPKWLFKHTK